MRLRHSFDGSGINFVIVKFGNMLDKWKNYNYSYSHKRSGFFSDDTSESVTAAAKGIEEEE